MARLLTLRRNLARLLTRDEVDDNFVNVASDFSGAVDPATLTGAYVAPYMRWADTGTGWLKRRNAANDAWEPEQRLLRRTVQPFSADELPTVDGGPVYVNGQGMAEWDAAAGKYRVKSPVPVGAVAWWPLRASIPAGQIPADGQTISRATFPDIAAMVAAGTLPVVSEADWQADPLKRGSYTLGDGSTTIRIPDLNGKSAGAAGAVFLRGDGARSAGTHGLLQISLVGPHNHYTPMFNGAGSASNWSSGGGAALANYYVGDGAGMGAETRPLNATGVWTIQAFGAVTNPGSVDAAQLASDYAVLAADIQAIKGGSLLEVGSNSYGTYYKYASGDMICFIRVSVTGVIWTAGTPGYAQITGITFPAAFVAAPRLVGMTAIDSDVSGRSAYLSAVTSVTTTIFSVYVSTPNSSPPAGGTIIVTGTAIGRWKA